MATQKKKQSLLSRLGAKLKTPKGRMVAILLTFAVIGGGVFVYKSFAATASWAYWPNGLGQGYPTLTTLQSGSCKNTYAWDKDSFGNNIPVIAETCPANTPSTSNASVTSTGAYIVSDINASNGKNHYYRACADVKGTGNVAVYLAGPDTSSNKGGIQYYNLYNRQYGNLVCGSSVYIGTAEAITAAVTLYGGYANSAWVNVRNVQLQRVN